MITSKNTLLYTYSMFLIGQRDFAVNHDHLRNIIARWFFMASLTGRYTASPESIMESDLARLRSVERAEGFIDTLNRIIIDTLTEDFWNIALPNDLATTSARSPSLSAYHASLNILGAYVLFSKIKVPDLMNPVLKPTRAAIERHHLFPRRYLEKIGITDTREINQIANYALVEWPDNVDISDLSPAQYFPTYSPKVTEEMMYWHALPKGLEKMKYQDFLTLRRKAIANVIRNAFTGLTPS